MAMDAGVRARDARGPLPQERRLARSGVERPASVPEPSAFAPWTTRAHRYACITIMLGAERRGCRTAGNAPTRRAAAAPLCTKARHARAGRRRRRPAPRDSHAACRAQGSEWRTSGARMTQNASSEVKTEADSIQSSSSCQRVGCSPWGVTAQPVGVMDCGSHAYKARASVD